MFLEFGIRLPRYQQDFRLKKEVSFEEIPIKPKIVYLCLLLFNKMKVKK